MDEMAYLSSMNVWVIYTYRVSFCILIGTCYIALVVMLLTVSYLVIYEVPFTSIVLYLDIKSIIIYRTFFINGNNKKCQQNVYNWNGQLNLSKWGIYQYS